jgi:hypothetical protein
VILELQKQQLFVMKLVVVVPQAIEPSASCPETPACCTNSSTREDVPHNVCIQGGKRWHPIHNASWELLHVIAVTSNGSEI